MRSSNVRVTKNAGSAVGTQGLDKKPVSGSNDMELTGYNFRAYTNMTMLHEGHSFLHCLTKLEPYENDR